MEPEDLQNDIYQIAKKNNVQPKDFFKILYQIILSTNRGPKIGPFIVDIGRKKIAKTLSSYIWRNDLALVHKEHNRSKKSGGFFLVIFGALLLIMAPTIYPSTQELGILSLIAGFLIGVLGFYIRFLKKTTTNWTKCSSNRIQNYEVVKNGAL